MVLNFYNLKEQPFGVTPDPRFLYLGPTHREALASLAYGIQSGRGFMALIAPPGMGKTTILHSLLHRLEGSARSAFVCQTMGRPEDILNSVLRDLGVTEHALDMAAAEARLRETLHAEARAGRKVIVVIDEAQNLDDSALEFVRLLSNYETSSQKLIQIILAGQPQLRDRLASPRMLQLRQRMSIIARLQPLTLEESRFYIAHRLSVAGYGSNVPLLTPNAEAMIARASQGIPRNINNICFNALSVGYVLKQRTIEKDVVREVLGDLDLAGSTHARYVQARGKLASWIAKSRGVLRPAFAWKRQIVACAVAVAVLASIFAIRPRERAVASSPVIVDAGSKAGLAPQSLSIPAALPHPAPEMTRALQQNKSHSKNPLRARTAGDPTSLWAKVKKQDSDAEVELAQLYLEGTSVPQNCQQAHILLMAASRKGNARAADLLANYTDQCQ